MANVIKVLFSAVLIDQSKFAKLNALDAQKELEEAYKEGKSLKFVDSFVNFGDRKKVLPSLLAGEDVSLRIEFIRGEALADNEIEVFKQVNNAILKIKDMIGELPAPAYKFADVPEGKNIDNIKVSETKIWRKDRSEHKIGIRNLQKIWLEASGRWNRDDWGSRDHYTISNPYHYVNVYPYKLEIGCQSIQRWELEQLALREGWAFPE